jgi:small-conductance mechanosensitive channel
VADYAAAQTEIYQDIIEQFRTNNVQIPFPQRDVRMITNPA